MAKYKNSDRSQMEFKMIDFSQQLVEGTIEHTIDYLIEHKVDLLAFDSHFQNDRTGATAYHPKVMLKVILYAYSSGILSSRKIEKACIENVTFMTLAAGATPHYTYIADFIHRFEEEIKSIFLEVL
ncbi:MAG: transposase, partial [Leptospirales bacterium]